jgi:uncharacterized protein (TIGR00255 family)
MIKSMTGFGQVTVNAGDANITVEVRSLNSKFLDLNLRLAKPFSEKEPELRNLVAEKLERGKVTLAIDYQRTDKQFIRQIYNEELFVAYYNELKKLASRVKASSSDYLFELAINSPDVIQSNGQEEPDAAEWERVKALVLEAIAKCDQFRAAEGNVLEGKLAAYVQAIQSGLEKIEVLDPKRIERVRSKIKGSIAEFFGNEGLDLNRLEQEVIYYIEKLDIHEERVRLRSHLDYFLHILSDKQSNGKKLGFIAQEIGREINTIGSKANDAEMQKQVVVMKEELEKIKEQLNNVL